MGHKDVMFTIREMKVSDAEQVASVQVAAWTKAYAGILPTPYLNNLSVAKISQNWKLGSEVNPDVIRLVAVNEKIVMGFAAGLENRFALNGRNIRFELWALYVHPAAWRSSVGTNLFREFRKKVKTDFAVWVLEENHLGRKFYEKMNGQLLADQKQTSYGGKELNEVCYLFKKE
jgi:GNAT superfamily N-acetyltransferase